MSDDRIIELLNNLPGMLYKCKNDEFWTMTFVSDGCKNLTGYKKKELLYNKQIAYSDLMHKDDVDWVNTIVQNSLNEKKAFSYEYRILTKDGTLKWVWEQGLGLFDDEGNLLFIEGFITDITEQKLEREKLEKDIKSKEREILINSSLLDEYKKAVDVSSIVSKTDRNGIITYVNDEFCKVSGFSRNELIGQPHSIIRHPQNPKSLFEGIWKTILDKRVWKGVIKNRNKFNKTYYVQSYIVPILNIDGEISEFIAIRSDVTDLILQEKKIKIQTTDLLTQLPNRQKLLEDLHENKKFKFAILNIERFKELNEYYGFDIGDRILVELATLLSKLVTSKKVLLYKLTGDEFGILADESIDKNDFTSLIIDLLDRVKEYTFSIGNHSIVVHLISGISMQKNYFINAEMAMNYAKNSNKDLILFDENTEIKEHLINNIKWTNKLDKAIKEDRIVVFIQPIVDNLTGQTQKYECLIRMKDEDGSIISPFMFLSVAKKTKLYPLLTRIVIEKAIEYFKDRKDSFSINLSLEDILDDSTISFLSEKISNNPSIAQRIVLEIVEDEGIENYEEVSSFISEMKLLGCKIAIDDFGTGYSNFDYLMKLNADFIKIDGSIIKNINHDTNSKIVTELIVSFANKLKIETIAEYVHNEDVLRTVKDMGISYSQGFHLGKPQEI